MDVPVRLRPLAFAALLAVTGCSSGVQGSSAYDARELPSGPVGQSIAYGRTIVVDTQTTMKGYVGAKMSCAACHLAGGTQPKGGSFVGIYGAFPQWNRRAHRVIALQDRIAECFLYSMNGRPPAYDSKAMIAVVAYIAWLSRGTPAGPPASGRPALRRAAAERVAESAARRRALRAEVRRLPRFGRRRPIERLSAALGKELVQPGGRHGASRPDDRIRPLQYAAERARLALGRAGL